MCKHWHTKAYDKKLCKSAEILLEGFSAMMQNSSGVGVDVITWPADIRGATATVQLSARVPSLSLSVICLPS